MTAVLPPLRPYQRQAAQAIVASVIGNQGLSFSVEIARQGGKNELSARIELALLLRNFDRSVTAIKAAPTFESQARISRDRLWRRLVESGLDAWAGKEEGLVRFGRARQMFLSAGPGSHIVGHTADLLLEIDEAQDVGVEKYDKELRPMAASTGATTVFYGTAWDDANLLERARQEHLEAERRDGLQRHFEFDWRCVAEHNPAYARFVEQERQRLGPEHPVFLTQFCLQPLPGRGRLLSPAQLSQLRGSHPPLAAPLPGEIYVAGLDIAGAALPGDEAAHDETVLTIGRVVAPPAASPIDAVTVEVVRHYAWQGAPHDQLYGALLSLLRDTWRVRRVSVDATGIGEPLAAFLAKSLPGGAVEEQKLSAPAKSTLGFGLLGAVNGGRLRLYDDAQSAELRQCLAQLAACRAAYRANQSLNFYVEPRDGHDDYVISLALLVAAAASASPRRARGRVRQDAG